MDMEGKVLPAKGDPGSFVQVLRDLNENAVTNSPGPGKGAAFVVELPIVADWEKELDGMVDRGRAS